MPNGYGVDHRDRSVVVTHCTPAHIHQVGAGTSLTGDHASVPLVHLSASLAGPGLSGSARPSRRCQDCSHPHRRFPDQTVLSFTGQLRLAGGRALSSLPGVAPLGSGSTWGYSASWRTASSMIKVASRRLSAGTFARAVAACHTCASTSEPKSLLVSSPNCPLGMRTSSAPPSRTVPMSKLDCG